jgi:hypothetical protein
MERQAYRLKMATACRECGVVMRPGTQVEGLTGSGGYIHWSSCPEPPKNVKSVNLAPSKDADDLFWERRCVKCRTVLTGKWDEVAIPARCNITTYEPHNRECGGELVDPDLPDVEWDELPAWLRETWERHGARPEEKVPEGEEESVFLRALADLKPVEPGPDDDIPF